MSAAAAEAAPSPKKGLPKKLLLIVVSLVVVLAIAGGAAVYLMKKKAAAAAEENGDDQVEAVHDAHRTPPTFVPLDPFTVNLADHDSERFAQIGVTFEIADVKIGEELKQYLPSIRSALLMVLAHKTSTELLERSGKEKLAAEIGRETARAMGYKVTEPSAAAASVDDSHAPAGDDEDEDKPKKKKKPVAHPVEEGPIRQVLFSSFIIQ